MVDVKGIDRLLSFSEDEYFVVSVYLNVDGKRFTKRDWETLLKDLIKDRRKQLQAEPIPSAVRNALEGDFERIQRFFNQEYSGKGAKSVACFSCLKKNLWQVYYLPQPVRSRLIVSHQPYLPPLLTLLTENKHYCVVLVSREKARIFKSYLGEIEECSEIFDEVPGKVRIAGWYGLEERRIERHIEDHVHRHLKKVADALARLFKVQPFDGLIIGGRREILPDFEHHLHTYLKERIIGRINVEPETELPIIWREVGKVISQFEKAQKEKLVQRVMEESQSGGLGVIGLKETLKALWQGQISTLLVQEGLSLSGYVCPKCGYMSDNENYCPYDRLEMRKTPDLMEEVVEAAMIQNCEIIHVSESQVGEMAGLLRFKI